MRNLLAVVFTAFLLSPVYAGSQDCKRHMESAGDYSLCPPDGWETRPPGDNPYHSFFGPASNNLRPNINVYDEANSLPMKEYVAASQKQAVKMALEAGFARIDIVGQTDFTTQSKEPAIRTVYSSEFKNVQIATFQYTFHGMGDRKITVTCTVPDAEKARLAPVCDQSLKTYRTEKKKATK